jgi:putative membrane protein
VIRLQVYLVGALIFALLVTVFAIQNSTLVDVRFLFWGFSRIPIVLVVLGSALAGALFMLFLGLVRQVRTVRHVRGLQIENRKLAAELTKRDEGHPDNNPD